MTDDVETRIDEIWNSELISGQDRIWASLAYILSPLVPIIILAASDLRNRPFIRVHAVQALITGLIFILLTTATAYLCLSLIWLIMIYWGWRAYQAQPVNIPLITPLVRNRGWV
jgi:uncharacterized membrane protein